jgi:hypothetical protein
MMPTSNIRNKRTVILRSAHLRASRRMAVNPTALPSFETLAAQAPQDDAVYLEQRA